MAVTYEAHDRLLDRRVAVKLMRPALARDPSFVQAFRREAQAAANLSHERIAGVYDTGADGQTHYIVMELVEGRNLKDLLRLEGPLSQERAVEIAIEVAEALAAAHERGIVHRDIKPANILLTPEGHVKVTDFGLARATTTAKSDTDVIVGSVHYFSPEQARGDAVGPQSDLYALGVVLFEMLTGRLPFEGENAVAVAHKQVYDRPPAPHSFDARIGPELDGVVLRCLEKDLSRRYASARELLAYLTKFRAGQQEGLFTVPVPEQARRGHRWGRGVAIAAGLAVVLGAIATGLWLWGQWGWRAVEMPDLRGMEIAGAQRVLGDLGHQVQVTQEESTDLPAGQVLRQEPAATTRLARGEVVQLWVSQGAQRVPVPDVIKMSLAQAKRYLAGQSLTPGEVSSDFSDVVPAGYVMATDPPVGERVEKKTAVALVVSKGPKPPETGPGVEPGPQGKETINFTVPKDVGPGEVKVRVELKDAGGTRVLYEDDHSAGESIPPLTITYSGRAEAKIYVADKLRWSRTFGQ
jgi:serine/threonine-protein kinase